MRYAHGIVFGSLLPGIVFIGAALINLMDYGITDPADPRLAAIWDLFLMWSLISVIIFVVPMIIARFAKRELFREIAIFEIGGFAFFTPLWFCLATEMTGRSCIEIILSGVDAALPGPGSHGIIGLNIESFMLVPIFLGLMVIGVIMLRPSFVKGSETTGKRTELDALRETVTEPEAEPEIEPETVSTVAPDIPTVPLPVTDESSKDELRAMLLELGFLAPLIDQIMGAGIASIPELVATGADQIAAITGLAKKEAEDLHMQVQKKVWFGGI